MGGVCGAKGSGWLWPNLLLGCQGVVGMQVYMPVGS